MDPIKLRLTYYEAQQLRNYVSQAARLAKHPQAQDELLVLADFELRIVQQCTTLGRRLRTNAYLYSIPVSVARLLHRRWQQEKILPEQQWILSGLDAELDKRNLKPDVAKARIDFHFFTLEKSALDG